MNCIYTYNDLYSPVHLLQTLGHIIEPIVVHN